MEKREREEGMREEGEEWKEKSGREREEDVREEEKCKRERERGTGERRGREEEKCGRERGRGQGRGRLGGREWKRERERKGRSFVLSTYSSSRSCSRTFPLD